MLFSFLEGSLSSHSSEIRKLIKNTKEFKKYLDKDGIILIDILLQYGTKYIPIEIAIKKEKRI